MQNDVLKNNIAPWQEKGRWYHGVYQYSGIFNFVADETDQFILDNCEVIQISSMRYIRLKAGVTGYEIIDIKYKINGLNASTTTTLPERYADGNKNGACIGSGNGTGKSEFWVFITS